MKKGTFISLIIILTLVTGISFVTPALAVVAGGHLEVTDITGTTAAFSASYNEMIKPIEKGACWDTTDNPNPTRENCFGQTPVANNGGMIEGLSPNTSYNFVIYSILADGDVLYSRSSDMVTFTTTPEEPTTTTTTTETTTTTTGTATTTTTTGGTTTTTLTTTITTTTTVPSGNKYTISATSGENGSIDPAGDIPLDEGTNWYFLMNPHPGYKVADVTVDGESQGARTTYAFQNVSDNHTIHVTFETSTETQYTIKATSGENGSISPLGDIVVNKGEDRTFIMAPDVGYKVADVTIDGKSEGPKTSHTFTDVMKNYEIHVTFVPLSGGTQYTINATAGEGGSIGPPGSVLVNEGESKAFSMYMETGYIVENVLVDEQSMGPIENYTFPNVTANHTIHVTFKKSGVTYIITATSEENGSISPSGQIQVPEGESQTFTIYHSCGYIVDDILVDNKSVGSVSTYTFPSVIKNHSIHATFTFPGVCLPGDANDDGKITLEDVIYNLQVISGKIEN
ncbi:hypothetical protein [Desulfonema magnum]|uniref:Dockerin domain-containing protein n=1 Tax=Desulfonema magnum TaxID=45655 RepID=A0A975BPF7_9BACT|nr:hypothetical protein [Desulfonema magnum]QTA88660.1 Uncharacterized protein dnm_047070 [Desulfonema magnum]